MFRAFSFLSLRGVTIVFSAAVLTACGGDEFGTIDPGADGSAGDGGTTHDAGRADGRDASGTGGSGSTGGNGGSGAGSGGSGGNGGSGARPDVIADQQPPDATSDVTVTADAPDGTRDGSVPSDDVRNDVPAFDTAPDRRDGAIADTPIATDATNEPDAGISPDAADSGDASMGSDALNDAPRDAVCTEPIVFYKDGDGDGFGRDTETTTSCVSPGAGWSATGGDCRDDLNTVKPYVSNMPNPPQYSGTGYSDSNKPSGISFDYDCSGTEEGDPTNIYTDPEPACGGPLSCSGAGYVAAGRSGPGINPQCGSFTIKRCQLLLTAGGPALCSSMLEMTTVPYRCR